MSSTRPIEQNPTILFFDGECNLCNFWVDFVLRESNRQDLRFASLQSSFAAEFFKQNERPWPDLTSLVLYQQEQFFSASDAALQVVGFLRFPWPLLLIFRMFPRSWRDLIYRWIARNRYRWFGKRPSCRLPTPEEANRFLG